MSFKFLQIAMLVCAGFLCLASVTVEAKRPEAKVAVAPATTPEAFAKQAAEVRESMRGTGRYSDISSADREVVEANLAQIRQLLEARGSLASLTERERVQLINAQSEANALLTENDGDRLICHYEKKTGSHFREKYCITASAQKRQRNENQRAFRDIPGRVFQDTGGSMAPVPSSGGP